MRPLSSLLCNFHWIVPGEAARSAQVHSALLGPFLAKRGIRALINLRGRHPEFSWWRRETGVCRRAGIAHFDAMLDSRQLPTAAMMGALFQAFAQAPRPFLIKCSGGQDRTSLAAALYLLARNGSGAVALRQFSPLPFLHFPKRRQRWLRHLPRYAEESQSGAGVEQWARSEYDPAAFAVWLQAQGLGHSYSRIYPS